MIQNLVNDPLPTELAKEIASRTLDGDYDPLLACRDLASLRGRLPGVADGVMDTFIGVASEVDELPIGAERKNWAAEALISKDLEVADYRERVWGVLKEALQELVIALGGTRKTN